MRVRGRQARVSTVAFLLAGVFVIAGLAAACTPRDPLEFTPTTLPDAQLGSAYTATVTVTHAATPVGGVSVQEGSMPPGLEVNLGEQHDNVLHFVGTPTTAGTYTFTIYVWCYGTNVSGQTASQSLTIVVK
jgi:hypothetical protein